MLEFAHPKVFSLICVQQYTAFSIYILFSIKEGKIVFSGVKIKGAPTVGNQSQIFTEFSLKASFKLLKSIKCFFSNVKRF